MKKSLFIFTFSVFLLFGCKDAENREFTAEDVDQAVDAAAAVDGHTSRNSLDWAGVYKGVTPCADCEGIKTVLQLNDDETYSFSMTYLGRPEVEEQKQQGKFTWDATGSKISLQTDGEPIALQVGENKVYMLDGSGNVIDGEIGERFILEKQ